MKRFLLVTLPLILTACSTPTQQSTVPMDMQAVADYQHRITTKQTVNPNNKANDEPLNQSDKRTKSTVKPAIQPMIYPSVGFGYHRGWGSHRYW